MTKSYLYFIALTLGVVSALTDDDRNALRAAARPIFEACGKEYNVTREEVLAAKESGNVDAIDSCFYACFFKKVGIINANGLFDADVTLEKNKKYVKDEEHLAKVTEIGKVCSTVNDETVTDGEKACDRSKLLVSCFFREKAILTPLESS